MQALVAAASPSPASRWCARRWSSGCTPARTCSSATASWSGAQGVVTEKITGLQAGRIKLAGEFWTAAPYDDTVAIEPGETVEVLEIKGATAYVHPVPRLES